MREKHNDKHGWKKNQQGSNYIFDNSVMSVKHKNDLYKGKHFLWKNITASLISIIFWDSFPNQQSQRHIATAIIERGNWHFAK